MTIEQHSTSNELPHHGGKLQEFSRRYSRPLDQWVDLSTGVSPYHYPIPDIPTSVWNRLPEDDDGLIEAAQTYYQCDSLLPVAGSQAAIQALPVVIAHSQQEIAKMQNNVNSQQNIAQVLLPATGYKEHQHAWYKFSASNNQTVTFDFYQYKPSIQQLESADVIVLINPNNPTTLQVDSREILAWLEHLKSGATLIVDEAFVDCNPELSVLPHFPSGVPSNLIVLRSVGKFFGLAGIRAGFCFASALHLRHLQQQLGPWTLSGPTRYITKHALLNTHWQQHNRQRLHADGERMSQLLQQFFSQVTSQALFHRVELSNSKTWHHQLAQQGIFTRHCDEQDALRFGLPANEWQWQTLTHALEQLKE